MEHVIELNTEERVCVQVALRGAVQGMGLRPFIYRCAQERGLTGWVKNLSDGVLVEVEGEQETLNSFLSALEEKQPPHCQLRDIKVSQLPLRGHLSFQIHSSEITESRSVEIAPDLRICVQCLTEIWNTNDRRYLYPFTTCVNCGPRFSMITALPYDRANTTMQVFSMCKGCMAEYHDPGNRRFHAQANACPECGPHLELWDRKGNILAARHDALLLATHYIRSGNIVAVKGLGGFQLLVDATNDEAVIKLRRRKHRLKKPFALMYSYVEAVRVQCELFPLEEELLCSPEAPIVLLLKKQDGALSSFVAPDNPYLGVMLPTTALHDILLHELDHPVVATSGNVSEESIVFDEQVALEKLKDIADVFLVHNRPIVRPVDDSVVRIIAGKRSMVRLARGYAPFFLKQERDYPTSLALGGHMKNTISLADSRNFLISQHIGDLKSVETALTFEQTVKDYTTLYGLSPKFIACDLHPDYFSTRYGQAQSKSKQTKVVQVQHHYAHALSCMAEHQLQSPVLAVVWDGTGYGTDGTIWGGEFLRINESSFERVAYFRTFFLPGGEKAVKEPRRAALGLLYELFGDDLLQHRELASLETFSSTELNVIRTMFQKKINTPRTSSIGRLFDGVSSILGLCHRADFEGEAAMLLEFLCSLEKFEGSYQSTINQQAQSKTLVIDWAPLLEAILFDLRAGLSKQVIAQKFHNSLAETVVTIARMLGEPSAVLSGGCFQNRYLTEQVMKRLCSEGFTPYWHTMLPCGDGGLSCGQMMALWRSETGHGS